jgi:hypothetical protein
VSQDRRPAGRASGRAARALAALLLSFGLVGLAAGCGFDAQLLKPYNPADGTNKDIGEDGTLKVRNLVVVSRAKGEGILSVTLVANTAERLTGATVAPHTLQGTTGPAVPVTVASPIELAPGSLVVLTNQQPLLTVSAPDLEAGSAATVVMQFEKAGAVTLDCPVVDGTQAPWSTISPSPAASGASGSPSPSPSPSATS